MRRCVRPCAALAAGALLALGGCGDSGGSDTASVPGPATTVPPTTTPAIEVPADRMAAPRDPGGDERASVRLPPKGRIFGLHGFLFLRRAPDPVAALGITAEGQLRDQLAIGATSTRIQVPWSELEPEPGRIDQDYVQRLRHYVDLSQDAGASVLLVLGVPAAFASQLPGNPRAGVREDEETVRAFARYAATVARLVPEAVAIETWNEPNAKFFWEPRGPDPVLMARLHRAAAAAIRAQDPEMDVLLPGLVASHRDRPELVRPQVFLKAMYASGLGPEDYDGIAIHPYPGQGGGRVGPLDTSVFAAQWQDFRRGFTWIDPDARIWVTETGVTTTGPAAVGEPEQARALVALTRKLLTTPRVKAVYLHTQYDGPTLPETDRERGFGILTPTGDGRSRPKAAWCALRSIARDPGPARGCP